MKALVDFDGAPVFGIPVVRGMDDSGLREGMLIEGPQGWGEFSPPPQADGRELVRWLTSAVEGGTVGWPDPVRGRVPVAVAVPAVDATEAHDVVARSGCRAADVRVAQRPDSLPDDAARVAAVRDALGPAGSIRCHANGAWDVDTAVMAITALEGASGGLEFVGQPCRGIEELSELRRRVDVRIAAEFSQAAAADVALLWCGPLGGVRRALRLAESCGVPCVVSSASESSIGLTAGLALAGALPELPFACGLATRLLLTGDVVAQARSLVPVDGYLPVAPMPASPEPELLARYALTDPARVQWWRDRLATAQSLR